MEKKKYKKPGLKGMNDEAKMLPPLSAAAALLVGYVAGRAATKVMDSRGNFFQYKNLRKVVNSYE